jgi:hypothetical protein
VTKELEMTATIENSSSDKNKARLNLGYASVQKLSSPVQFQKLNIKMYKININYCCVCVLNCLLTLKDGM